MFVCASLPQPPQEGETISFQAMFLKALRTALFSLLTVIEIYLMTLQLVSSIQNIQLLMQ